MPDKITVPWARIREAYCNAPHRVRDICARYGVSTGALYYRIHKENWPKRSDAGTPAGERETGITRPASLDRAGLVARLTRTLDLQMRDVEARLEMQPDAPAGAGSTADRERDARTLSSLVRTLDKLIDLEGDGHETGGDDESKDSALDGDSNDQRKELARRIANLVEDGEG